MIIKNKALAFFYAIYSLSFFSFIGSLLTAEVVKSDETEAFIIILAMLGAVLLNIFLLHILRPDFFSINSNNIITSRTLKVVNCLLFFLCTIQYLSYYFEKDAGRLKFIRLELSATIFLILVVLITYLSLKTQLWQESEIKRLKDSQLKQLSSYTSQIESLYNQVRSARHDFVNIIATLGESINTENIGQIQAVYNSVLKQFGKSLSSNKYNLGNLRNMKVNAVKGILAAKIIESQSNGIATSVEIYDPILTFPIELLDLVRIISIFFDNAIEAAKQSKDPSISVAFINSKSENKKIFIIKNSCEPGKIDKHNIFKPGKTTKEGHSGIGLATAKQIISEYRSIELETEYEDSYFTQTLRMGSEFQK